MAITSSPSSGLKRSRANAVLPDHGVDARALVLEGEIAVAGGMRPAIAGNLAAHAHMPNASSTVRLSAAESSVTVNSAALGPRQRSVHGPEPRRLRVAWDAHRARPRPATVRASESA